MRAGADGRPEPTVARQSSPELALLAEFALPLPSLFLTSTAGAFGFAAGDAGCLGGCLSATVAPVFGGRCPPLVILFLHVFLDVFLDVAREHLRFWRRRCWMLGRLLAGYGRARVGGSCPALVVLFL